MPPVPVASPPDAAQAVVPHASSGKCMQPLSRKPLVVGALAAALCFIIMPFAGPAYLRMHAALKLLPLTSILATAVQIASPMMVTMACVTIITLDHKRRKLIVYLLVGLGMSCGTNDLIKEIAGRARPEWSVSLDSERRSEIQHYVANHPGSPVRATTDDQWLWFASGRPHFSDRFSSFPSGHSCGAFALAAFLSVLYPEARLVWIVAAFCCALARIRFARHFPDDVLFGGGLGWAISAWVFSWKWPMRLADTMTRDNVEQASAPIPERVAIAQDINL